ncbi:MAG: glycosyltransferase family 4 protein, partial [Minisyncoccia bacterium]
WKEGNEPKLIKGPDIFLSVIEKLKLEVPNIFVLLSGPSRGFIKNGLKKLDVPFVHHYYSDYKKIANLYDALDLYLITSREEGGPKACLESMAKGIPLVTTAVGQCKDLVINNENAMMTEIEDVNDLALKSINILGNSELRNKIIANGLATAKINSYANQENMWKELFGHLINKN